MRFNTSYITINPITVLIPSTEFNVSIHRILLLIGRRQRKDNGTDRVSIHRILLLIEDQRQDMIDLK